MRLVNFILRKAHFDFTKLLVFKQGANRVDPGKRLRLAAATDEISLGIKCPLT
jgi:hypothetical protein